MSTDRELLEDAAKAAGLNVDIHENWTKGELPYFHLVDERGRLWNPITDDGDALRLAVTLRIDLYFGRRGSVLAISHKGAVYDEHESADPYAATRRAIVRAAAAIGAAK